jgi:exodeoxyribonuclease III
MPDPQRIRIVTWNCCKGNSVKRDAVLKKYNPDIAIIQEIDRPEKENDNHGVWVHNSLTKNLGVSVISSHGWELEVCPDFPKSPEVFVPVKVRRGEISFNLLGVWTQKEGKYIESFQEVLENCQHFFQPSVSVIAGDFNSNPQWDKMHKKFCHTLLNENLKKEFGLVSAYHAKNPSVLPGAEDPTHSTFFMYGHRDKPFHIDYCYVPENWEILDTEIGSYDEWCNKDTSSKDRKSDHCPLIVDLCIRDLAEKQN